VDDPVMFMVKKGAQGQDFLQVSSVFLCWSSFWYITTLLCVIALIWQHNITSVIFIHGT